MTRKLLLVPLVPLAGLGIVEVAHWISPAPVVVCVQPNEPQVAGQPTSPPSQHLPEHPGPQPKLSF